MKPASVPAEPGFRHRGTNVSRLETFVDAAFAFSLSLLVIFYGDLPDNVAEMREALRRVPTFAACFALIALFWTAHRRWSRRFGLDDAHSTVLSLAVVLVVMVYVYPLRMVVSSGLSMLTGGWVVNELGPLGSDKLLDLQTLFMVYSAGFGLLSLLLWGLNAHARRHAEALRLDRLERFELDGEIGMHRIGTFTAALSIALSLGLLAVRPAHAGWMVALPMWTYAAMGCALAAYFARRNRHAAVPRAPRDS